MAKKPRLNPYWWGLLLNLALVALGAWLYWLARQRLLLVCFNKLVFALCQGEICFSYFISTHSKEIALRAWLVHFTQIDLLTI
jgi:hypothetical protein